MKTLLFLGAVFLLLSHPLAADPKPEKDVSRNQAVGEERLVFVTGSLIPQRIKVRPTGTTLTSPLRIIGRHEIDGTGRVTTLGAFANEPSVRTFGH